MQLIVDPVDGPADEVPSVLITGTTPDATVQLVVEVTDQAGVRWRSSTTLRADASGQVRAEQVLADPSAPWWSMWPVPDRAGGPAAPAMFAAPADLLRYRVRVDDDEIGTCEIVRRWAPAGAVTTEGTGDGFRTVTFSPVQAADRWRPAVVLVPGSSGAGSMLSTAGLLATHGYVATVVRYLGGPGLSPRLHEVPLERLAGGIRAAVAHATVEPGHFAVLAASVGCEGVLATLAAFDEPACSAVVAIAPSSLVWQAPGDGAHPTGASSWTLHGSPLPWAPVRRERLLAQTAPQAVLDRLRRRRPRTRALRLRPAYAAGLAHHPPAAEIPAERIDAPLLLLAGEDDQVWPSVDMATRLLDRRARAEDRLLAFPDAGHHLQPPVTPTTVPDDGVVASGGTAAGNARAQAEGWHAILDFLSLHLG